MTIYEKLVDSVSKGQSYYINFKTKDLKLNKKYLVRNGVFDGDYGLPECDVRERLEELFENYYFSVPSERSELKTTYFHHIDDNELEIEDLVCGESRFLAQAKLEGYVLGLILSKCSWSVIADEEKHFFWRSKKNKNLIMWKEWFEE